MRALATGPRERLKNGDWAQGLTHSAAGEGARRGRRRRGVDSGHGPGGASLILRSGAMTALMRTLRTAFARRADVSPPPKDELLLRAALNMAAWQASRGL